MRPNYDSQLQTRHKQQNLLLTQHFSFSSEKCKMQYGRARFGIMTCHSIDAKKIIRQQVMDYCSYRSCFRSSLNAKCGWFSYLGSPVSGTVITISLFQNSLLCTTFIFTCNFTHLVYFTQVFIFHLVLFLQLNKVVPHYSNVYVPR